MSSEMSITFFDQKYLYENFCVDYSFLFVQTFNKFFGQTQYTRQRQEHSIMFT